MPFDEPLAFPSGIAPRNLDQLALACQNQWAEACGLLADGTLERFLQKQGRLDLADAARQAATNPDCDQGLDYLLSRLPSANLGSPRLEIAPTVQDMGRLEAGKEASFVLHLTNRGQRLIAGTVTPDVPWLQIEGAAAGQPRLVQFNQELALKVILPGPMLMAAKHPWQGQVIVETTGGAATLAVTCTVPIVPFAHAPFQGCHTPRDLAQAVQKQPQAAVGLFAAGAVKAWYRSNGWTYPVSDATALGNAVVRQYFEALGLPAPHLDDSFDVPVAAADALDFVPLAPRGPSWGRIVAGTAVVVGLFLLMAFAGVAVYLHLVEPTTPLSPYAAAMGPHTSAACQVDLVALRALPGMGDDAEEFAHALTGALGDLGLAGEAAHLQSLFLAHSKGEPALEVWSFSGPVVLHAVTQGRFEMRTAGKATLYLDRTEPTHAWATDERGRLVHGPVKTVQETLARARSRQRSPSYVNLTRAAAELPAGAAAWALIDFQAPGGRELAGALGAEAPLPQVFRASFVQRGAKEALLQAEGTFVTPEEASSCREKLAVLGKLPLPLVPGDGLPVDRWTQRDASLRTSLALEARLVQVIAQAASAQLKQAHKRQAELLEQLCLEDLEPGKRAMKFDNYGTAVEAFGKVVATFPGNPTAQSLWHDAQQKQKVRQAYLQHLQAIKQALAGANLELARTRLAELKAGTFAARDVEPLEKELRDQEQRVVYGRMLREAEDALRLDDLPRAQKLFDELAKLKPDDAGVKQVLAGVARVQEVEALLGRSEKQRAGGQLREAGMTLHQALDLLGKDPPGPIWQTAPLPYWRGRLFGKAVSCSQNLQNDYQGLAETAQFDADLARLKANYAGSVKGYERAVEFLEGARNAAADLQRLGGPGSADAKSVVAAVEARIVSLRRGAAKVQADSLIARAKTELHESKMAFDKARVDSTQLPAAKAKVDSALQALRDADKLREIDVSSLLREAEALAERFGRLAQPFEVDFSAGPPPETWKYRKDQWQQRAEGDIGWLQAAQVPTASLLSDAATWPYDFELEVTFALVTPAGKVNNQLWDSFTDPLTITLIPDEVEGSPLVLRVGKDPALPLQNLVRLTVNKESNTLQEIIKPGEPIKLTLQSKRQVAQIFVNGRRLRSVPARHGFGQIRFDVVNAYNPALTRYIAFPALYKVAVKPLGAAE
jgi:hypothetical protein